MECGSWFVSIATDCAPNRCIASSEEREQQQHQADEKKNMYEVAGGIGAEDAKEPYDQQHARNLEEHLASRRSRSFQEATVELPS
jgi:hypothetical protein